MVKQQFTIHLIRSLILEYRLSLETVYELFGNVQDYSYSNIIDAENYYVKNALIYVLDYETKGSLINQKQAKRKTMAFLTKFKMLKSTKEKVELVNKLNDNSKLIKIKNSKRNYTKDDIKTVIKFRYKYALSRLNIAEMLNITRMTMVKWEKEVDDEFAKKLEALNSYNNIVEQRKIISENNKYNR